MQRSLQKKEREIQVVEGKIKAAKVYVKALRDVLKILENGSNTNTAETTLRDGSAVAQARDVILKRETPVHITELLEALGKEQTREARASLVSSLSAYVRRSEIFSRAAPNTFGLIELGHDSEDDIAPEPPAGFGQISPPNPPPPQDIRVSSSPPAPPRSFRTDGDDEDESPF